MSKEEKRTKKAQTPQETASPEVAFENSPGKQLVKAREALGLTSQQVADRLHLRLPSVKAVEEDALEQGVSVTFNKGYVRLYAKLVNLEVQPLLDAYDRLHTQDNQPAKLQSFSRRVSREADDHKWNMVTIVIVLLVLGSVIGWWWQQSDSLADSQSFVSKTFDSLFSESEQQAQNEGDEANEQEAELDTSNLNEESGLMRQDTGPAIPEEVVKTIEDTQSSLSEEIDEAQEAGASLSDDGEEIIGDAIDELEDEANKIIDDTSAFEEGATGATETVNGVSINSDGTVDMVFTFDDECWVSIKDVNDEIIAIGVKAKGRVMSISGLPPIKVILGAPQSVAINFGGKEVDMSVHPATKTANFLLSVESE